MNDRNGTPRRQVDPTRCAPKSPIERRRRRDDVARLMLQGKPNRAVMEICSEKHGVSTTTIKQDIRHLYARWAREDGKGIGEARARVMRRLERLAVDAEKDGNFGAAIQANVALAKILGLLVPPSVAVAVHNQVQVSNPQAEDDGLKLLADPEVAAAFDRAHERRRQAEEKSRIEGSLR